MIQKTYVKSRKIYKVKFEVPLEELPRGVEVQSLHLVGDFNDWQRDALPLKQRRQSDPFVVTLEFLPGQELAFRYLLNGELWVNAWAADWYTANELGEDNCVLSLPLV